MLGGGSRQASLGARTLGIEEAQPRLSPLSGPRGSCDPGGMSSPTFVDRLDSLAASKGTCLTVGLDPDPKRLPRVLAPQGRQRGLREFVLGVIEATRNHCIAYKFQLASYLAFGPDGMTILPEAVNAIGPGHLTILDLKASDIPNTMELYRRGIFEAYNFDAMTVNPFLGWEAVDAAAQDPARGIFVLAHTSNPGAKDIQEVVLNGTPLWTSWLDEIKTRSARGNLGAVVGATDPAALLMARQRLGPRVPLLIPGVGAQGATLAQVVPAARGERPGSMLINSSRGILFASDGEDWKEAAGQEAARLTAEIRSLMPQAAGKVTPTGPRPRRHGTS